MCSFLLVNLLDLIVFEKYQKYLLNLKCKNSKFLLLMDYPLGGGTWNSYTLDSTNISDISQTLSNPGDLQVGNYTFIIKARDKYPNGTTIREVTETGIIIRHITAPTITDDYANDGV